MGHFLPEWSVSDLSQRIVSPDAAGTRKSASQNSSLSIVRRRPASGLRLPATPHGQPSTRMLRVLARTTASRRLEARSLR